MTSMIQLQDELIGRFMKRPGGLHPQTTAAAWRFFQREMKALGFTNRQIDRAYDDAKDMAYLLKLCKGEVR